MFEGRIPLRQGKPWNVTFTLSGADAPSVAGLAVRAQIRDTVGGTILQSFTSIGGSPNAFNNMIVNAGKAKPEFMGYADPSLFEKRDAHTKLEKQRG